jgi:hypothetical protein
MSMPASQSWGLDAAFQGMKCLPGHLSTVFHGFASKKTNRLSDAAVGGA